MNKSLDVRREMKTRRMETENRNEREMEEKMREWRTDFSPNTYICKISKIVKINKFL